MSRRPRNTASLLGLDFREVHVLNARKEFSLRNRHHRAGEAGDVLNNSIKHCGDDTVGCFPCVRSTYLRAGCSSTRVKAEEKHRQKRDCFGVLF